MDEQYNFYGIGAAQDVARNDSVTITTSSTEISPTRTGSNPRKMILVRNMSTADADVITVNLGFKSAVANTGIILKKGESFSDATDAGYQCHQGAILAICATANGVLAILER